MAAIAELNPSLIINAGKNLMYVLRSIFYEFMYVYMYVCIGTAGGFKRKGAAIGDAFISTQIANHDRRIPIPGMNVCMYVCMCTKLHLQKEKLIIL